MYSGTGPMVINWVYSWVNTTLRPAMKLKAPSVLEPSSSNLPEPATNAPKSSFMRACPSMGRMPLYILLAMPVACFFWATLTACSYRFMALS